nr:venom protein 302-like [Cherax quadricarinatus]
MNTVILLCLLSLAVTSCLGLSCLPCDKSLHCRDPNTLECPWGIVTDLCNCCPVCGKGPGKMCGGPWNINGKCGRCLVCKQKNNDEGICVSDKSKC